METPPAPSLVMMRICLPISSSDERMVARTCTSLPGCVRIASDPNEWSMETRPLRNARSLANFSSKRLSSSSARRGIAERATSSAASARRLRSRNIGILPQHVVERLLFFRVHGQQLLPEMRVLSIAIDVGLALLDRIVEEHQLFLVRDHQRRLGVVELRVGELLQLRDGPDVLALRGLD